MTESFDPRTVRPDETTEHAASVQPSIRLAHPDVGQAEADALLKVLYSGVLTNGPRTAEFETVFAARHEVQHAVAFANGTVALAAMYIAKGIGIGDEVIVPSMTFISSATSVLHVGATPVFADVDPCTFNLDPSDVATRITPRTKAILAVHYGGQPADMAELSELAQSADVYLFEDAAQAHGVSYRGRPVGGLGDAAMFSFTPTKNITTGEGGILTMNDGRMAQDLRLLRNHGQVSPYHHARLGWNWRMTEFQAALGVVQIGKLDAILERKRQNAAFMETLLAGVKGLQLPVVRPDRTHGFMLYTLLVDGDRDRVMDSLIGEEIEARLYFPPAHLQPMFGGGDNLKLPVTEDLAGRMISVPFHSHLTPQELKRIAACLTRAVKPRRTQG